MKCNKKIQQYDNKDCNTCKDNKEVIENIAIIRSALKMMRLGALNNPNLRQKIERALKWVDLYIVK